MVLIEEIWLKINLLKILLVSLCSELSFCDFFNKFILDDKLNFVGFLVLFLNLRIFLVVVMIFDWKIIFRKFLFGRYDDVIYLVRFFRLIRLRFENMV